MATITLTNTGGTRFDTKTALDANDVMDNFEGTATETGILRVLNPQGTAGGLDGNNIATSSRTFLPFHFREPYGRFKTGGKPGRASAGVPSIIRWNSGAAGVSDPRWRLLDVIRPPENCMLARMGCYIETMTGFVAGDLPINLAVLLNTRPQTNLDPLDPTNQYSLLDQWVDAISVDIIGNDQRFEQDSDVRMSADDLLYVVIQPTIYPAALPSQLSMTWSLTFKSLQRGG